VSCGRDEEREHAAALARAREREAAGEIRQCNEGRWHFSLVDDDGEGNVQVRVWCTVTRASRRSASV
jgi:hypothetical protein